MFPFIISKYSPQKSSLLLSIPWTGKQDKVTALEDETLKLHIIHPGVVIATWKVGVSLLIGKPDTNASLYADINVS